MTATTGFTGIGAALKKAGTNIGNTTSFNLDMQADQVDATHLLSTDGYREYKAGFKSATVGFEGHYDPDTAAQDPSTGLIADFNSGDSDTYKADFTGADNGGSGAPSTYGVITFTAVVTQFSISVSEGMVTWTGTLSLSAAPTWGAS